MNIKNIFSNIPDNIDDEIFEILQQSENVKIEKIVSKGQCSPLKGWYDQTQHEWVIVLKGEAILEFESGERKSLLTGDYINISAHTKHKVHWTDPNVETVWLAVFY